MTPHSLRLKGFRGIRDGLGRDEIFLDLQALPVNAQLVALTGANGKGKSTLMDNLHPYPVMPSRAGADGLGAFSYYDQLCASEAEKEFVWEHDGRQFRTHLVFRMGSKRKVEAYLFERPCQGAAGLLSQTACAPSAAWKPVRIADGTASDGKMETYERCVEALLGSAQTFFTSVFSAQGKRQISGLRNGEVKSLLADLLNLEEIRLTGQRAGETVRLLKTGLLALRQERAGLADNLAHAKDELAKLGNVSMRLTKAQDAKEASTRQLATAQTRLLQLTAEREAYAVHQQRRDALLADREQTTTTEAAAIQHQLSSVERETQRLSSIERRAVQRKQQSGQRLQALAARKSQLTSMLASAARIAWAARRLNLAKQVCAIRQSRQELWAQRAALLNELQRQQQNNTQRIASIEREAGQAALRVDDLARRLALTAQVPCAGTDFQGKCKLLGDAHEAQTLKPSADAAVEQLAAERREIQQCSAQIRTEIETLVSAPMRLAAAEQRQLLATDRVRTLQELVRQAGALQQAKADLLELEAEVRRIDREDEMAVEADAHEREQVSQTRDDIEAAGRERQQRFTDQLTRIDRDLATLPSPFDSVSLATVQAQLDEARLQLQTCETTCANTLADVRAGEIAHARIQHLTTQLSRLDERLLRCEKESAFWTLLAKGLSHDGVIALCIDDAGPTLAGLANDLLLSCYGPRFTVSIHTLLETAKGEAREGFDIIVHDAESGQSKSMSLMSGGERVWINECLTRAVALHLSQESGRRYATLFSDEADGPLDPDRKRMFMAMKREVLRLGGYEREFFISQTPELTAMADAVIDIESLQATAAPA